MDWHHNRYRLLLGMTAALVSSVGLSLWASASPEPPVFTGLVKGVAVGGYDTVAYFSEKRAVPGQPGFAWTHGGAEWRFASAANRDAFKAEPQNYAPQYGGYCAFAVANGYTAKGDPLQWTIVNNRLFLNYDASVKEKWLQDTAGFIAKADNNWPGVLNR
ncbi:MAG: YHS domain-containing (seleno)protein [Candidatus Binatia bacterium]